MSLYLPFAPTQKLPEMIHYQKINHFRSTLDVIKWSNQPLRIGAEGLYEFGLEDAWKISLPGPYSVYSFFFEHILISSQTGIIQTKDGHIIEDSLYHAQSKLDLYQVGPDGKIAIPQQHDFLDGCWLSLLLANQDNYFHFLLMNLARLSQLNQQEIDQIQGILIPKNLTHAEVRAVELGLFIVFGGKDLKIRQVGWGETLAVERLCLIWNIVSGDGYTYSDVIPFFQKMIPLAESSGVHFPSKIYIDRRGAVNRPLVNEDELVGVLEEEGFLPVKLENLTFDEQILLFQNASSIIGAHGAGLTNMVFCKPNMKIIEFMPHTLIRWCYRQLAMISHLDYDCVITHSASEHENILPAWASHYVPVMNVMRALEL